MEAADLPAGWAHLAHFLLHKGYSSPCWGMNRGSPWSWMFSGSCSYFRDTQAWSHQSISLSDPLILLSLSTSFHISTRLTSLSTIWCNFQHCYNPLRDMSIPCSLNPNGYMELCVVFMFFCEIWVAASFWTTLDKTSEWTSYLSSPGERKEQQLSWLLLLQYLALSVQMDYHLCSLKPFKPPSHAPGNTPSLPDWLMRCARSWGDPGLLLQLTFKWH